MEPPNKGHVGANINSAVVRLSSSRVSKCIRETNFWDLETVSFVERSIVYTVSLSRRVHYWFHGTFDLSPRKLSLMMPVGGIMHPHPVNVLTHLEKSTCDSSYGV